MSVNLSRSILKNRIFLLNTIQLFITNLQLRKDLLLKKKKKNCFITQITQICQF